MRNKIRLSLIVAFIGLLIASCENEEIDSMYKDFRFQTKILPGNKADPQSLYLNTAFPFSILSIKMILTSELIIQATPCLKAKDYCITKIRYYSKRTCLL